MKIGVLGAGQLGRMLALAGYPLGFEFLFLDPAGDACAAPLGEHLRADYDDRRALEDFCARVDLATFEFENVPADSARFVASRVPLAPGPVALAAAQDRLGEKRLFERLDIPVPRFAAVDDRASLLAAVAHTGLPAMLKTRRFGYDGKGQRRIDSSEDLDSAWDALGGQPLILEAFVPFEREVSCLGVRAANSALAFYPLTENEHRGGILHRSRPLPSDPLQTAAQEHVRRVLEALDYVGVLAFEFFVCEGRLLGNEIAPRVHNSGHWTIEGAVCSQFENHLRSITGLPLGSTDLRGPCAMVNLIGDVPALERLLAQPEFRVHLHGKNPKALRKLGHVTVLGKDKQHLGASLAALENLLA